jgi:hypothetical protein
VAASPVPVAREPTVEGRVGPERVRMNEKDKSNETKVSKDGLQVRLLGLGRESALWGAVCVCVCCLTLVDVAGCVV